MARIEASGGPVYDYLGIAAEIVSRFTPLTNTQRDLSISGKVKLIRRDGTFHSDLLSLFDSYITAATTYRDGLSAGAEKDKAIQYVSDLSMLKSEYNSYVSSALFL